MAQNDGTTTEYFGYDGLGSVRQMLDAAGGVLFAQVFDPYGNSYTSAGTDNTRWGFTGEQTGVNGLIFLRARCYTPYLNRFIQRDPTLPDPYIPADWNRYAYVRDNPVNLTDPSGMCAQGDQPCLKAAQRLFEDYGWYFVGQWQLTEIELLRDAAKEIAEFFDDHGGNAQARMRGALSPVWFARAGLFWIKLGYHHVEAQTVYLLTGFSKENVIHESAHVLDNLAGSSIYASLFGGGPSDEMARSLGVDPTQCPFRFSCSNYLKMLDEAGSELPPSDYAARGPSEDFAVTLEFLATGNGAMQKTPVRGDWMASFIEGNKRTRPAYEGNPYQYLWFLPQPIPVPDCSLPPVLVTPQP
ncbi:MAG: RHS repeat-associated core domain-containing protein [Anaerolineales bacterium]